MTCQGWLDDHWCAAEDVRAYVVGLRCPQHTPARLAGRDEIMPDPELTLEGLRAANGLTFNHIQTATAVIDEKHRKSGKSSTGAQRKAHHADPS